MDVVEADIPESLQQVVDENKFAQEAMKLLQSAGGQAAMNQTPPTPPTVAERVGQKAEEGVAGLLTRLSPGIQQQGQQMARAQQRPPMQGQRPPMQGQRPPMPQQGMAGMPARNMQGMARGGVIGYAGPDGSQVKPTPMPTRGTPAVVPVTPEQVIAFLEKYKQLQADLERSFPEEKAAFKQRIIDFVSLSDPRVRDAAIGSRAGMARGGIIGFNRGGRAEQQKQAGAAAAARRAEARENQSIVAAKNNRYAALLNEGVPAEEARAIVEAEALAASGEEIPFEMRPNSTRDVGNVANIGGIAGLLSKAGQKESPFRVQGMEEATPTVGTPYDPTGRESANLPSGKAQDTFDPPVGATTAPPFTSVIGDATEAQILAAFGADANAAATTRGDRAKELMGLEGLMAERKALQGEARGLREERFSPERMKKRTWRAGLAGLAEKGLGGFGSGATTERDKIDAERAAAAGISIDEMNSLITELRAMGMTQFEAENKARDVVETRATSAISAGARLRAEQSRANQDQLGREATAQQNQLNRESNLDIAKLNALRPTDFMNEIKIRVDALQASNSALSDVDARSQALEARIEDQARAQLSAAGIRADSLDLDRLKAAYSMAGAKLANRFDLVADSEAFNTAFREEVKNIMAEFGTPSTGGSSTGPAVGTESGGFRFTGGDPADRNNWQEI
jgi:hypothetical protein